MSRQSASVGSRNENRGSDAPGRRTTGVVDEDVEPTELLDRGGDDLGGCARVHQIDHHMAEVLAGERVDVRVALAGDRDDLRALLEECAGDGEANALRGTGDDGDVLGQLQIDDVGAPLRVRVSGPTGPGLSPSSRGRRLRSGGNRTRRSG
jgi:hypothetical protein